MSQTLPESQMTESTTSAQPPAGANNPSYLEAFLNSFFQEKNIKWMLIVGASIVFGSSLMLVTKAWPQWTPALKYMTILGYTGVIFFVAEVSRKRLGLSATYRVLHALTLLLLPVCFLSLTWLSSGTAVQHGLRAIAYLGLLIPAIALLWIASTTILDHWLRGRQTSFLVSFCVLCIAGATPAMSSPILAFGFLCLSWFVFTVGVVKVNRHTFWLTEHHQQPQVLGFLPIAMLGLQFVVLAGTRVVGVVPMQWLGFAVVMVSATVLMTARTVADVFRRRSGDLVRPLPWPIIVPLFGGIVLNVLGVALSMSGFSYFGATTYAIIPASIVASFLFALVARDTRHSGFVWASLVLLAIAYQCSPTLFADWVQTLRTATAEAINRSRVPISMYGLTYLPLLGVLAATSRYFAKRKQMEFSEPIKHFVTIVSLSLFAASMTDTVSLFFVASVNTFVFVAYAIAFQDRRYVVPAIAAAVIGCGVTIPALGQMGYAQISVHWIPTALAVLAMLMTLTKFLDQWVNKIPTQSRWMRYADGRDRNFIQWTGCVGAGILVIHWIVSSAVALPQPLSVASLLQFGFLISALVLYTLRNPQYISAAGFWILIGYTTVRWAFGLGFGIPDMVTVATWLLFGLSLLSYLAVAKLRSLCGEGSLSEFRHSLGFDDKNLLVTDCGGRLQRTSSFTVSLFDLSVFGLSALIAVFHTPALLYQHATFFTRNVPSGWEFGFSTLLVVVWLFVMTKLTRSRNLGLAAATLLPLAVTATMISAGFGTSLAWMMVVWAALECTLTLLCDRLSEKRPELRTMQRVGELWLLGLLAISCASFEIPLRVVAAISVLTLGFLFIRRSENRRLGGLAISANINLLLGVAAIGGCSGWLLPGLIESIALQAIPLLFLAASVSMLAFDISHKRLDQHESRAWAMVLRIGVMPLVVYSFVCPPLEWHLIAAMTFGFSVLVFAELRKAVRQQHELRVWTACLLGGATALFLFTQHVITFGVGISQLVLLSLSVIGLVVAHLTQRDERLRIFRRPMLIVGQSLPSLVAVLAIVREFSGLYSSSSALNAFSLMMAAGIYFHQGAVLKRQELCILAILIANAGLALLWRSLGWGAAELYMVPVGLSVLGFVELMKKELPQAAHTPLRYIGTLTILCSPLFQVLGGSWVHILTLMVLSVVVILIAIGLRIRSLVYAGSAFLLVDLVAMVIRSTIGNLNVLWISGVVLGIAVIALAAFCENHRDKLLSRIRIVTAQLATWN